MMKVDLIHRIEGVRNFALNGEEIFFSVSNKLAYWSNGVIKEIKTYADSRRIDVFSAGRYVIAESLASLDVWDRGNLTLASTLPPAYQSFYASGNTILRYYKKQNETPAMFAAVDLLSAQDQWTVEIVFTPQLNGCVSPDFFAFANDNDQGQIFVFDTASGRALWQLDLNRLLTGLYAKDEGSFEVFGKPACYGNTLILQLQKFASSCRYIIAVDVRTGVLKWHHRGWNNFAIHGDKVFNLEYDGWFRKVDGNTGVVEEEIDLKKEFNRSKAEAEGAFTVTDKHVFFKYAPKNTFGVMDLNTRKIVATSSLPAQKTIMNISEPPVVSAGRLYLRSTMADNLFVYKLNGE